MCKNNKLFFLKLNYLNFTALNYLMILKDSFKLIYLELNFKDG